MRMYLVASATKYIILNRAAHVNKLVALATKILYN